MFYWGDNRIMKEKLTSIILYVLIAAMVCVLLPYQLFMLACDDIVNYFYGGILKYIFLFLLLSIFILPVALRKKFSKKWNLPAIVLALLVVVPLCNNGILKIIEDDLRIFSREKWDKHEDLRIYMLDDLQTNYIFKGQSEERVIGLLGEPSSTTNNGKKIIEYYVNPGYVDAVRFYIVFEDGVVAEMGKNYT